VSEHDSPAQHDDQHDAQHDDQHDPNGVHERIEALLASDDYPTAFAELLECATQLQEQGDRIAAARTLMQAGHRAGAASDRTAALEAFERARELARAEGDAMLVARCEDGIAAAHWELGRLDVAEQYLRSALAVWNATSDVARTAWAQYRLGWCLAADQYTEPRGAEALDLLGKARATAQATDDVRLAANCDEKAAWVLAARGDTDRSIALLRTVVDVFDSAGDDYARLVATTNLAHHLMDRHQMAEAEFLLRQAVQAEGDHTRHVRLGATSRLAKLLCRTGRADEALRLLDDVAGDVDADDRTEAPRYHLSRAAVFQALTTRQATKEAAETALDLLDRTLLPAFHAEALEYLAWVAKVDGQRTQAESLYAQAMALYLLNDDHDDAMRVAGEVLPEPPRRNPPASSQAPLPTGLYL
jgi:tetratricopeptide (TPR) repeat protein